MAMFIWFLVLTSASLYALFGVAIEAGKESCFKVKWYWWIIVGGLCMLFLCLDIYLLYKTFNALRGAS